MEVVGRLRGWICVVPPWAVWVLLTVFVGKEERQVTGDGREVKEVGLDVPTRVSRREGTGGAGGLGVQKTSLTRSGDSRQ